MSSIPGRGVIKTPPNAKVIVLPTCSYCGRVAPECQCGRPERQPQ